MIRAVAWAAALILVLTAGTVTVLATPHPPAAVEQDEGCPRDYPRRLPSGSPAGGVYSRAIAGLVFCTNGPGTGTLLNNGTAAVWILEEPAPVVLHRLPTSSFNRSFLRLVDSRFPAIPPSATVVVPASPATVRVRIDPGLTLAQLTHDELVRSLALGAVRPGNVLDRYDGLLSACLGPIVDRLGPPERVLESGNPAPEIITAALEVATASGPCAADWPSAGDAPLADDVSEWRRDSRFAVRSLSAYIAYSALEQPLRTVR